MSRVKYDGWVLKERNYLFAITFKFTRTELISATEEDFGMSWSEIKKDGYSAVKVKVVEVEG